MCLKLLLFNGALVNCVDDFGLTPLNGYLYHQQEQGYDLKFVENLLQNRADPNIEDYEKVVPLLRVCLFGNVELFKIFLRHGADINSRDVSGATALHYAAHNKKSTDVLEFILKEDLIDVNIRDNDGNTAFLSNYIGCEDLSCRSTVVLLKYGGDFNIANIHGRKAELNPDCENHECPVKEHLRKLNFLKKDQILLIQRYRDELDEMKKEIVCWYPKTSLYDLLFMNREDLVKVLKKCELQRMYHEWFEDFENKFPNFGFALNSIYRLTNTRKEFTEHCNESLHIVFENRVPPMCAEKILRYLGRSKLEEYGVCSYEEFKMK